MNAQELASVLKSHVAWLRGEAGGERANLSGANLIGASGIPARIPVVEQIDAKILAAIGDKPELLQMDTWHKQTECGTTHCRAGWAVTLAGDSGGLLEDMLGTNAAASLIYAASRPGKRIPDFFASNKDALASIKSDAAEQASA